MSSLHYFEIKNTTNGLYMIRFNYNSEAIVWSEVLSSKAAAQNNIDSVKCNAPTAPIVDMTKGETGSGYRFEIFDTADKQFMVRFKAPNGETVVVSEHYTAKHNAIKCVESVRNNAATAKIVDNTNSAAA